MKPVPSPFLVPFDGSVRLGDAPTAPPDPAPAKDDLERRLQAATEEISAQQRVLHAQARYALLLVFQGLDASGKDGTIRHVLTGVNPAGCRVHSFQAPSPEEIGHDFLWRHACRLPERGRIGVFNRSWYEEVLVLRVHPDRLAARGLHDPPAPDLWTRRLRAIREYERHLATEGTVILKFWLHLSRDAQRDRFLARIDEPDKHWKFSAADVRERAHWDAYQRAADDALNATSRPWAPWHAVPADDKPFLRTTVAELIAAALARLPLRVPDGDHDEARLQEIRDALAGE